MREKSTHYPGFEPLTSEMTVGYVNHCTTAVVKLYDPEFEILDPKSGFN
jgi:hypothetical protein